MELIGASVLPIAVDPATGRGYAWLGQERYRLWSDFGGRFDPRTDSCAEETAAREMAEETLRVFGDADHWKRRLRDDKDYLWKVRVKWNDDREFVSFIVRVPWNPLVASDFADLPKDECEKRCIALFPLPYVHESCKTVMALRHKRISRASAPPFLHIRSVFAQTLLNVVSQLDTLFPTVFSVSRLLTVDAESREIVVKGTD